MLSDPLLHRERILKQPTLCSFSSNDYLGLTQDPYVKKAFQTGFDLFPVGSGGSMVVSGYHDIHKELEQYTADILGVDDAVLFSSGYAANLAVMQCLKAKFPSIIMDKGMHASFYDGQHPHMYRYAHQSIEALERLLERHPKSIVLTESIFSMHGSKTNLEAIAERCRAYGTNMIVDEAHAFGILGPKGIGLVAMHGLSQELVPLRVIPLGKAIGFQGALVAGTREMIDSLIQHARSYIYSTGVSPALAYGILKTLQYMQGLDSVRDKLWENVAYFRKRVAGLVYTNLDPQQLEFRPSETPIQGLILGCPERALDLAAVLESQGLFCQPMRYPTVSHRDTGLRITLHALHQYEDIDRLLNTLEENVQ